MIDILELNEQVFQYLNGKDLSYTYRKSNYAGRLDQGYWFYGNENYLAVSFWSGMDWKNRTPNIIFVITYNGGIYLEINVSDSDRKREFVTDHIIEPIGMEAEGRRFKKWYRSDCDQFEAMEQLEHFLSGDKRSIDQILHLETDQFFLEGEDRIGQLDRADFRARKNTIQRYRDKRDFIREEEAEEDHFETHKPLKISSFKVWDYGPIHYAEILDIPLHNQWVFITGENGSGKTSFLRAIGTALGYRALLKDEQLQNQGFRIEAGLIGEGYIPLQPFYRQFNEQTRYRRPKVIGLCMYGPFRIYNSRKLSQAKFQQLYSKGGGFASLFSDNAPLLDIDKQLDLWKKDKKAVHMLEKRQYHIKNILTAVVPSLYNIDLHLQHVGRPVEYYTRETVDANETSTKWEHLSSGTKSVFSLIVDILLRLYDQQPRISDPAELRGVVLIDEIDLHLHPLGQKNLVTSLTNVFPAVQFIVTTHSPIPLLGAPRDSGIYVMHNRGGRISMERMDDKVMFSKILPNAIFTSPIFGFRDLLPDAKDETEIPALEDDYREVEAREQLSRSISAFLTNDKQRELFDLFNRGEQ